MKYILNIILGTLILITSCKNSPNQVEKEKLNNELSESEIYFASKRINESFSERDSTMIEYITKFLIQDSIKVTTKSSIEDNLEIQYLKGNEKLDFFYNPEIYNEGKTRRKSNYYNVDETCYEFNNEGISHNSIYITKLCYKRNEEGISLVEIYLLDGD